MKTITNNQELKFLLSLNFEHLNNLLDVTKKEIESRTGLEASEDLVLGTAAYFISNEMNFWTKSSILTKPESGWSMIWSSFSEDLDKVIAQTKKGLYASKE